MAAKVVPVPRGARLVSEQITVERHYVVNRRLYLLNFTMDDAIYWFDRCLTIFESKTQSYVFHGTNFANVYECGYVEYTLYLLASNYIRHDSDLAGYFVDAGPECFGVQLYRSMSSIPYKEKSRFEKIVPIEDRFTGIVAIVSWCWPEL